MCNSLFITTFKLYQMTGTSDAVVKTHVLKLAALLLQIRRVVFSNLPKNVVNCPRFDCRVLKLQLLRSLRSFLLKDYFLLGWYYFGSHTSES